MSFPRYSAPLHDLERDEWLEELELRRRRGGGRRPRTGSRRALPGQRGFRGRRDWGYGTLHSWGPADLPPTYATVDPPFPILRSTDLCTCPPLIWPGSNEPLTWPAPPWERSREDEARYPATALTLDDWRLTHLVGPDVSHLPARRGVYVVMSRLSPKEPYYVGISDDIRGRWAGRLREARQAGLLPPGTRANIQVWTANVVNAGGRPTPADLRLAEHALVRLFRRSGYSLVNESSINAFQVNGPVRIDFRLPRPLLDALKPALIAKQGPGYIGGATQTLQLPAGSRFESESCPLARPFAP
jgi:hypothetical protein